MTHRLATIFGLLAAVGIVAPVASSVASQDVPTTVAVDDMSGLHDFDFLVGEWRVHSSRLKEALAGSHEWYEFDGTIKSRPLMEGRANVDDTVFNLPQGIYRGVAPRAYDPKTAQWAIWWIDGRNPFGNLDPPVKGRFVNGVGTFYANDTLRGKPIKVRFIWSNITKTTAEWQQAYSPDDGKTWETNWKQKLERTH